ncbi:MAG: hypothetical protein ACNS61_01875 [Candidatus Wenzhouxiangella sp. M2_3B_020]
MSDRRPALPHLSAVAALAGAVLAFEVVLLRLFEFSHWHHFAGLTIALALLGFGAAGTLLSLLGERAERLADGWLSLSLLITLGGFVLVLMMHTGVSLRPLFAVWDAGELLRLLAVDFAAFVPFFGAGLALGQVFARWPQHPGPLYAANLGGSGIGAAAATALLAFMLPEAALPLIVALLAAFTLWFTLSRRMWGSAALAGVFVVAGGWLAVAPPQPKVSDFKALAQVLDLPDAQVLEREPGLGGRLTVIRSSSLRFAPGLSLNWTDSIPASDVAVLGSDQRVPVREGYATPPAHREAALPGLPLLLRPGSPVLVLGVGSWSTPAYASDRSVTWVASDTRVPEMTLARGLNAEIVRDRPERFAARSERRFGLITLDRAFDGRDAASEDYLLTPRGLRSAFSSLEGNGLLAIPLAMKVPPRNTPRVLTTLADALEGLGIERPADHVIALRGLQSLLILVSPGPLSDSDVERTVAFAADWSFDLVWHPGLDRAATNRFHVLDSPLFHDVARAALAGGEMPEGAGWFRTEPASSDRPYVWHAMRWRSIEPMFERLGARAASYLDWTLVMSAVALVAAALAAAVLIVAPLGRMPKTSGSFARIAVVGYFGLLGVGFMLVELAFLQRMIGYAERPVVASAIVFATFLVGAGFGSATAPVEPDVRTLKRIFATLAVGAAIAVAVLWWPGRPALSLPTIPRIALLVLALLPMTWAMGRPFPWGLAQLARSRSWLPWAWAVNGFASVVAASMATMLSVQAGQRVTLTVGLASYALAGAIAWRATSR